MRKLLRQLLQISVLFLVAVFLSSTSPGQHSGQQQTVVYGEIHGQIRIDNQPAPPGMLVLLDVAPGFQSGLIGSGQTGRTMTDSAGKFGFDHIAIVRGAQDKFLVTVRQPGYRDATQVADFGGSPRALVLIELKRDTSRDTPNVPPGGPAASISARQPVSSKAQEALAKGEELLIQKHDPKASMKEFGKLVEIDPRYAPGFVLLGTAHLQLQEFGEAKSAFEKATKLQPDDANAFLGLGLVLNEQKEFTAALKPLQHSLELRPDSAEAHYEMGKSLWALGKWQEAEPHARKALELNNDFAEGHILMGNIYLRRRDANSALKEFKEYLKRAPRGRYTEPVKQMVMKIEKALAER